MIILLTYTLYFGLGCYDSGENSTFFPLLSTVFKELKKLTEGWLEVGKEELQTQQPFHGENLELIALAFT